MLALVGAAVGFDRGPQLPPVQDERSPEASAELRKSARTIRVPEDQPTIAGAMAVAQPGDTVKLGPGDFRETVSLKTGVRLLGSPSTIDATGLDYGVLAQADVTSATVESLIIRGSNAQGILVEGAHGVRLTDVTVQGCGVQGAPGIQMDHAQMSIEDSVIRDSGGAGIRAVTSDLTVNRSQVHGNAGAGLRSDGTTSSLRDSVFAENKRGVVLVHGSVSTLERNELSRNSDTALYVYAGDDIRDQVRCTVKSSSNLLAANERGIKVLDSDLASEDDRFDGNGDGAMATLSAQR